MNEPASRVLSLFNEDDLKQLSATGSPWVLDDGNPATVPVPLQVIMVKVDGPYNERDRKLWTFLLHAVWEELGEKPIHSLSVAEINRIFRELGGDHNTSWIWESAKRLAKTTVEWEYTLGDERVLGVAAIFGAVLSKAARQGGRLSFHFPPLLIPIIKQPQRFARLRVHFLIGLSGKYAVTLYELMEGFANRRDGRFDCSLAELRTWLKVPAGGYEDWKDFKKRVLDPAMKQINDNPHGAGFTVSYDAIRAGRNYDRLRFTLTKTKSREQTEIKIKKKMVLAKAIAEGKATGRQPLLAHHIEKARKATDYYLDMDVMQREFWEYWDSTGRPQLATVEGAFVGFCKKKYRQAKYNEQPKRRGAGALPPDPRDI